MYASLQPFAGWRMPPAEVLGFLTSPWPRYITATDISLNVIAYLPLGAMLYFVLRPPLAAAVACVIATLLAATLSLMLESVQMFLPTRIASNVDLLSNSAGAATGALGAMLLTLWSNPLAAMRRRTVRAGKLGDCGLLVIALWIVIQFNPSPLAFGSGNLRDTFGIAPMFMHSSQAYLLAETAVVTLTVIALGLAISLLMQSPRHALRAMALTLVLTAIAKSIAAITIARTANWLQWLTPGVVAGFVAGAVGVAVFAWLAPGARSVTAIVCLAAGVMVVNITPDNPYQTLPAFLSGSPPTHLANFGGIVRILSQCWPFAAILLLAGLARAGPARAPR